MAKNVLSTDQSEGRAGGQDRVGFRTLPYQHIPHPKGLEHVFVAHIRVEQTIRPKRNPMLNGLLVLHGKEGVESFWRCQPPHSIVSRMRSKPIIRNRSEERRVGKECRSRWSP